MKKLTVAWFSAGVSSAVATKLEIDRIDRIIYTHIDDQHQDTMRFVKDCEQWFGKPIEILQSKYKNVSNACRAAGNGKLREKGGFINSPRGANCTSWLKKRVRKEWEQDHSEYHLTYVWGMDAAETKRADRLHETMPDQEHLFPLIERRIHKSEAHQILKASGIKRPAMYDLGYPNNNCVGCVKGGRGYWNKIRVDFPEVFAARATMEREIGASCINGIFLDELDTDAGRNQQIIVDDCGILCEMIGID